MKTTILTIVSLLLFSTSSFAQNYDLLVGSPSRVTCDPNSEAPQFVNEMAAAWASDDDTLEEALVKINVKLNEQWIDLLKNKTVRNETEMADFKELLKSASCVATLLIKQKNYDETKVKMTIKTVETRLELNRAEYAKSKSADDEAGKKINEMMWDNRGAISFVVEAFLQ